MVNPEAICYARNTFLHWLEGLLALLHLGFEKCASWQQHRFFFLSGLNNCLFGPVGSLIY